MQKEAIIAKMTPEQKARLEGPTTNTAGKSPMPATTQEFKEMFDKMQEKLESLDPEVVKVVGEVSEGDKVPGTDMFVKDVVSVDVGDMPDSMDFEEFIKMKHEEAKAKRTAPAEKYYTDVTDQTTPVEETYEGALTPQEEVAPTETPAPQPFRNVVRNKKRR